MPKKKKKNLKTNKVTEKELNIEFSLKIKPSLNKIIIAALVIISAALSYYYISYAFSVNKEHGFTLDDPWIHLTFARNIAEYGSFSYFKDEVVTSGSTSPLYTFILAAGFLATKNEMALSYILGILFMSLSVLVFYRLSELIFEKENWLAISAALIFVLDKWLNLIADSGMETTMYIFILIACFYYYRKRKAILFALMLGLSFWTRPDAVAFIAAVAADYTILLYFKKKSPGKNEETGTFTKKELKKAAVVFFSIISLYFVMNFLLSGSILPNTYGAKVTYYSPEFRSRSEFLKVEVWQYFTDSSYIILLVPFMIALVKIFKDLFRSRYNRFLLPAIFIFALIFIYWYKLPYAHRFGRYLMPVIPFYILLFTYGSREFFRYAAGFIKDIKLVNGLNIILIAVAVFFAASEYIYTKDIYAEQTHHISIRQVATARWLKENTPENSIIATHDVGAIAYYSDRRILDVVGLINPEFTEKLLRNDFAEFMMEQMKKNKVTHIAFLREWFQVTNQNPVYTTGENNYEIMDVFKFDPNRTHILSGDVNAMNNYAYQLIMNRQLPQAVNILNRALNADPLSSPTLNYLGFASLLKGDLTNAEKYLIKAIELFPDYRQATLSLADVYKRTSRRPEAENLVTNYLRQNPSDTLAIRMLRSISDSTNIN